VLHLYCIYALKLTDITSKFGIKVTSCVLHMFICLSPYQIPFHTSCVLHTFICLSPYQIPFHTSCVLHTFICLSPYQIPFHTFCVLHTFICLSVCLHTKFHWLISQSKVKATDNFQKAAIFYIRQRTNIICTCRTFCKWLLPAKGEVKGAGKASGATAGGGQASLTNTWCCMYRSELLMMSGNS
jgi:hypothetical protein